MKAFILKAFLKLLYSFLLQLKYFHKQNLNQMYEYLPACDLH